MTGPVDRTSRHLWASQLQL